MEFVVGDKVRFLNDVGGGKVTQVLPRGVVMICDHDGFEYQALSKELILMEQTKHVVDNKPKAENASENEKTEKYKSVAPSEPDWKKDDTTNIFVAFVKKEAENNSHLQLYLINDSNFFIFYNVIIKTHGYEPIDADILEPNSKLLLAELTLEKINQCRKLIVQISFFGHKYQPYRTQIEKTINIIPLNIWQDFRYNDTVFFDDKAYLFDIIKENITLNRIKKEEKSIAPEENRRLIVKKDNIVNEDKRKRYSQRPKKETVEVDLHITSLVESTVGLSNAAMLELQKDTFHKALTDALINKNVEKIIFIHGIGNGVLKTQIRESIEKQYKLQYEDASYREYGFGATMVIL
jgi:hypothetical protein